MTGYLDREPAPTGATRLFCFHHAGAGASAFAPWRAALAPRVAVHPVQLPGRETRIGEPRITDLTHLLDDVERALDPYLDGDVAFYGHSMGAVVAAGLAARRPPRVLLVGAYPAPQLGPPLDVTGLSDDELADRLVAIGGMSELVRRYPDWTAAAVALLRADLDLLHSRPPGAPRLHVPVRAYTGAEDPLVRPAAVRAWADLTSEAFSLRVVPGGHFFLQEPDLLDDVARTLAGAPLHA
jgi:surfactin synthase thioesterase subunit